MHNSAVYNFIMIYVKSSLVCSYGSEKYAKHVVRELHVSQCEFLQTRCIDTCTAATHGQQPTPVKN